MRNAPDPVDRALACLADRAWPGGHENTQLENELMRSFPANTNASFLARHRVLVPALAVLTLAGAAFAAAGGIQLVRSWFIKTSINGQLVDAREVVVNADGSTSFMIPVPKIEGDTAVIDMTVEAGAGEGSGGQSVSISLDSGETPGQAKVTITPQPEENNDK